MLLDKAPTKVACDLGRTRGDMIYNCIFLDNCTCTIPLGQGKQTEQNAFPLNKTCTLLWSNLSFPHPDHPFILVKDNFPKYLVLTALFYKLKF